MPINEEQIKKIIKTYYGLDTQIQPLSGETDLNYCIETSDKKRFLLKISHLGESRHNLEFQNAIMDHLNNKNINLIIPSVIRNLDNDLITEIPNIENQARFVRLLTWTEGRLFSSVNPHSSSLLNSLGQACGKLSLALRDFNHSAGKRYIKWDPSHVSWTKSYYHLLNSQQQNMVHYFYQLYENYAEPLLPNLRKSVNYNDANDYNVLVNNDLMTPLVHGIIDFGDAVYTHTINELAIAITYAIMNKPDPLNTACEIVKGYHSIFPLHEDELKVLLAMIGARLVISLIVAVINAKENPHNAYLQISYQGVLDLMQKIKNIPYDFAYFSFRAACQLEPCTAFTIFKKWTEKNFKETCFPIDLNNSFTWLDLSVGSLDLGNYENIWDVKKFQNMISRCMDEAKTSIALSRYHEIRLSQQNEVKTLHLGMDFFISTETEVKAIFDGEIYRISNADTLTIILRHCISTQLVFYSCYSFLAKNSDILFKPGDKIKKGEVIGQVCQNKRHLNFQIRLDLVEEPLSLIAHAHDQPIWNSLSPDPWLLFCGVHSPTPTSFSNQQLMEYRKQRLGKNMSIAYREPLKITRGYMQYLFDDKGGRYLDTVNNVPHVGHENARVVKAGQRQMAVLNTNTRYLHENIIHFIDKLLATLPKKLNVAFIVNSGSEANELAIRLAKNFTAQQDMIVVKEGYHGNTNACIDISSYKFDGPGGKGASPYTHVIPLPDIYRGIYKFDDSEAGKKYAKHVFQAVQHIFQQDRKPAAFICESIISCGGQIVLPKHFLKEAYQIVRNAGGVCIADEVQTGCGRPGNTFWAFEEHNVIPDIVTIGKPIGNGHPLAAVVMTQDIADAFKNGMEYFNTFGGNPVSCAIGIEVLNIIQEESLQQHAKEVGFYLSQSFKQLQSHHPIIGDIRGPGLFIGVELVKNRHTLEPATDQTSYFVNRMRDKKILMSSDGPYHNVIKIKPPMIFNKNNVDFLIDSMNETLREDFLKL